ncbi:hypothetical protein SAMN05446635_3727 [Burkholderia sp. OK233]|nr:hypothetical protein SAMN05446635_3727 [Burkholderia sp. OK233]
MAVPFGERASGRHIAVARSSGAYAARTQCARGLRCASVC